MAHDGRRARRLTATGIYRAVVSAGFPLYLAPGRSPHFAPKGIAGLTMSRVDSALDVAYESGVATDELTHPCVYEAHSL